MLSTRWVHYDRAHWHSSRYHRSIRAPISDLTQNGSRGCMGWMLPVIQITWGHQEPGVKVYEDILEVVPIMKWMKSARVAAAHASSLTSNDEP